MKSQSVTIQMKQLSSNFLWYCLLCCTRWFYFLSLWLKSSSVTIQMKATEQYFPVVLFFCADQDVSNFQDCGLNESS